MAQKVADSDEKECRISAIAHVPLYRHRDHPSKCGSIASNFAGSRPFTCPRPARPGGNKMPDRSWFFASNGQQHGPYGEAQLRDMIARGAVQPDTLVWSEGMS